MGRAAGAAARTAHAPARPAPARPARRRSGPARGRTAPATTPRARTAPARRAAVRPRGALVLDRLLRGRVWVACIGALLVGVVFFNVSLLRLNEGIARTSERATALKAKNADLRRTAARLGRTERIQEEAVRLGLVLPAPGKVRYLKADPRVDADRAAKTFTTPQPATAPPPVAAEPAPTAPGAAITPESGTPAPAGQAPAQPAPPQPAPAPAQPAPSSGQAPVPGNG